MKYCKNCKQNVKPKKEFSWLWFILWCFGAGVGGIVYLTYYFFIKRKVCPMCKARNFTVKEATGGISMDVKCNKCKADFEIKPQKDLVEYKYKGELIEKQFFICPRCGEEYIISYMDREIKIRVLS